MDTLRSLGYTLHHLSFMLDRQSDMLLQEHFNMGFSQFKVLMVLHKHEGIQQREIADTLGQTEASVSRQIKVLIEKGLVDSRHDSANRRQRITRLTSAGIAAIESALMLLENHYRPMFEKLSDRQINELTEILHSMQQHVVATGVAWSCARKERQ